ncbi:MAG: TIGR01459 family HAD-type hydrolase [Candidatus Pelagibacterales bacterium]|nr:MAG: TIGR01459 family HAD-type hydrolase [Pelagibacterales bacterium]
MAKKTIKGLKEIYKKYDVFFIDLWGVIHNGVELYSEAIKVLENLHKLNKKFVLMSNAPRPTQDVEKFLLKLKMNKIFTQKIFTSGEAALKSLKKNDYGKSFFHLGPERDKNLYKGLEKNKTNLKKADFILCTGLYDDHKKSLDFYRDLLKNYTRIKMVCTNPDLTVHRGNEQEYCAGSLADVFLKLGGKVVFFGKPYPEIYKTCFESDEKVLVIGDNLRTDIKGANNMKFDSLFITNGIHKDEFLNTEDKNYEKILEKYEVKANYFQQRLNW